MIRTFLSFLAGLAVIVALPAVAADDGDPWYQVELIVFEHAGAATEAGLWQGELALPTLPTGAIGLRALPLSFDGEAATLPAELPLHGDGEAAFIRLEDERSQLAAALNRLLVTPRYTPLLHVAWLQPATTSTGFAGVRLNDVDEDGDELSATGDAVDAGELLKEPLTTAAHRDPLSSERRPTIDGTVRLSRSRFLHLALDLRYSPQGATAAAPLFSIFGRQAEPAPLYRLAQSRRVRSGELNYFDHPRFGAIVLLTPYPAPEN